LYTFFAKINEFVIKTKIKILGFTIFTVLFFFYLSPFPAFAQENSLSRGQATDLIVKYFQLEEKNRIFLQKCDADLEMCLFPFSARSDYDGIRFDPLILYPDVFPANRYYQSINLASKLDLVKGYSDIENSPFRPFQEISKIEALKIILGASERLKWEDNFEYANNVEQMQKDYNQLVASSQISNLVGAPELWWKVRYVVFAVQNKIVTNLTDFDPDSKIDQKMLYQLMEKANQNNNAKNPKTDTSGNQKFEAQSAGSEKASQIAVGAGG
jgi:hypothetical protein